MPDALHVDLRARREVRETALWHLKIACGAAWASALWAVMLFWFLAEDAAQWMLFWRVVSGAVVTASLGWWLWSHQSRAAASILGLLAAGNLVVRAITTESYVVVVIGSLLCLAYYRAWRATETLHALRHVEASELASRPSPFDG